MNLSRVLRSGRRSVVLTAVALALLLAGCSSSSSSPAKVAATGPTISLHSLMFAPAPLRVKVGTKVTWRNDEPITHTVTSGMATGIDAHTGLRAGQNPDGRFNARLKGDGDTFSYVFAKPGTYPYYCDIHFGMNAMVVVTS